MEYIDKNLVFEIVKRVFNLLIEEDKVKSLLPKISNDTLVLYEGFMHDLSDLYKFVNNEYKDKIVNVVLDNITLDNLTEMKEVDLEKEIDDYIDSFEAWEIQEAPIITMEKVAKHFFELGLKAQKE